MEKVALLLAIVIAVVCTGSPEVSQMVEESIQAVEVDQTFGGLTFDDPVALVFAGDRTDRAFVVEKPGRIVLVTGNGGSWSTSEFLDVTDRVNDRGNEEGLLGLALYPEFDSNGHFYVYYTASDPRRSVVSRFAVSAEDPDVADARSEIVILEVSQPYSNHNGGQLLFGPDEVLYVGVGDGGGAGDPGRNGQDTGSLLGTILRIDVSMIDTEGGYVVPTDNPLTGVDGARPEIWAYGLRNPWRFTFDRLTGDLWAADVGQNSREEVDLIEPGRNYGWNIMEGSECFSRSGQTCDREGLEPPVVEYGHDEGCSITGGYVYRGDLISRLHGKYVYGDFCSGKIWAFDPKTVEQEELIDTRLRISSFAEDPDGEIYALSLDGGVYRIAGSE